MNDYASRLEKKTLEKDNLEFSSKKLGVFIYAPCWIAIGAAFLHIAMGLEATHYLITGSLLALVCGSLGQLRAKIIQQNQTIQILQENLVEVCGTDLRRSKN